KRIHLFTALDDDTRKLVRRNRRQAIDRPLQLATRDRRRVHAHQHLARIRRGRLDLLHLQAVILQPYRQHRTPRYLRSDSTIAPSAPATTSRSASAACSSGRTDAIGTLRVPLASSSARP